MPWLAVLGRATWRTRDGVYPPGVHEVTAEVAERARAAGIRSLVVSDERPEVARDAAPGEPLKLDDLKRGRTGIRLAPPPAPELAAEPPDPYEVPRDFLCPHCPEAHPSRGSLLRHVEFHHDILR